MSNVVHITGLKHEQIALELVSENARAASPERAVLAGAAPERAFVADAFDPLQADLPIVAASRAFFVGERARAMVARAERAMPEAVDAMLGNAEPGPAVLREQDTGLVRTVHREIVVRFKPRVTERQRRRILREAKVEVRHDIERAPDQFVVADPERRVFGADLIPIANRLADLDEIEFATPNFVSEYRRELGPRIGAAQWHLDNVAAVVGQLAGQDVRVRGAWKKTRGVGITIAIIDDGVDLDHPYLRKRIWRNEDIQALDQVGRDFFLPNDHPDHYNPRPKTFGYPYDSLARNDIHGTPCAGLAASAGFGIPGVAPSARILAVKIFHASDLASDERVADAIRYAASRADVISCSWTGGSSPDVEQALEDAGTIGRGGRGSAVFCATGNGFGKPVGFPARAVSSIAVGASTDAGLLANYSNVGAEVEFVTPSGGGMRSLTTTDVSYPGRGFDLGTANAPALTTPTFSGTSGATPIAAGVAALVLSLSPSLGREDLRGLLRETCDPMGVGAGAGAGQRSVEFGFGRVNAARAVEAAIAHGP
jgi:subtilisin family serine protease